MAITVKELSEVFGKDVFTTKGFYAGKVKDVELDLNKFKIRGMTIEVARGTFLDKLIGGKKGIKVPYDLIQAVGDIVLIKHVIEEPVEE